MRLAFALRLPLLLLAMCAWLDYDERKRRADYVRSLLLFLAVALPWFAIQTWHEGPGFLTGFFFKHNLSRFDTPMEGHGGRPFYYVPVVLLSLLPHTALLLVALARLKAIWRDELLRFGLLWFLLAFVAFSFSGTKLPHYVYYGYGGLVLILAAQVEHKATRWLLALTGAITFARQALASLRTRDAARRPLEERAAQLGAFVGDFHDGHGRDQDLTTEDDAFRVTKYQLADADCRRFRAHVAVSWPCLLLIARLVGEDQRLTREANARDEAEEAAQEAAAAADPVVA